MMYLNGNEKGATAISEVQNIAIGAQVSLVDFRAKANVSLMQIAFAVSDPALWATGNGLQLDVLIDDTSYLTMKSEFSDLKCPSSFFVNIKAKQGIKVELTNNTGLVIAEAAIKLDVLG